MSTTIEIRDTRKHTTSSSVNSNENSAIGDDGAVPSGTNPSDWLTLDVDELTYNLEVLTDPTATPQLKNGTAGSSTYDYKRWKFGDIDQNGISNPVWKAKGLLDLTLLADAKKVGRLILMAKTKGYKEFKSTGSTFHTGDNTTDYASPLINYSQYEDDTGNDIVASINVRITNLTFNSLAREKHKFIWTLDLIEIT